MPKGTKKTSAVSSDPRNRKETRMERKARLEAEKEAMKMCKKLLPTFFVLLLLSIIGFAIYVKSLPVPEQSVSSNIPPDFTRKHLTDEDMAAMGVDLKELIKNSNENKNMKEEGEEAAGSELEETLEL